MYQSLTFVGRLGRDPEARHMPSGEMVVTFPVATDRSFTDKSGARQKETTWFRVTVFGKQAESCNQYLNKGKIVLVEGRLGIDAATGGPKVYATKDGKSGASFDVLANDVRFIGGDAPGDRASAKHDAQSAPVNDGDIPF